MQRRDIIVTHCKMNVGLKYIIFVITLFVFPLYSHVVNAFG